MIDTNLITLIRESVIIKPNLDRDELKLNREYAVENNMGILYSDEGGSFSSVFFRGNLAYKYTSMEDVREYDVSNIVENTNGLHYLFLNNCSDAEVLKDLDNEKFFPKLYHWENCGNYAEISVVERIEGTFLSSTVSKMELKELKKWVTEMVKWSLDSGWIPLDVSTRNILKTDNGFRLIDLGLFQRMDTFIDAIETEAGYSGSGISALYELIGENGINIVNKFINGFYVKKVNSEPIEQFQNIA